MRKRGHHVRYSITQAYTKKEARVLETEFATRYRRELQENVEKFGSFLSSWKRYERFRLANRQLFDQYPWLEKLPPNQIMCVVRLTKIYGFEKAARIFIKERKSRRGRRFLDFVNEVASGVINKHYGDKIRDERCG
jgi:hypothetical protein